MNTKEIREKIHEVVDKTGFEILDIVRDLCDEVDLLRGQSISKLAINEHVRQPMDTGVLFGGERILLETGYQKFADRFREFIKEKFPEFFAAT